jgi:hypothetical protein
MGRTSQRHRLEVHGGLPAGGVIDPDEFQFTSMSPDTSPNAGASFTLHCYGGGFGEDSLIEFNGSYLTSEVVSQTEMTAVINLSWGWPLGPVPVKLWNDEGEESNVLYFTFTEPVPLPDPTLDSYSPSPIPLNYPGVVTITGTNLDDQIELVLNEAGEYFMPGDYTCPNSTTILITAPDQWWYVGPDIMYGYSNTTNTNTNNMPIEVAPPPAVLTSLDPDTLPAGSGDWSVDVHGNNFYDGDVVYADDTALSTFLIDSTWLLGTIPGSMTAAPTELAITVHRGALITSSLPFTVTPALIWSDFLVEQIDPTSSQTITGSPVQDIRNPDDQGFDVAPRFQQTVSVSSRPAITAGRLVFDGINDYLDGSAGYDLPTYYLPPDSFYSQAGKGPTCTGLARASDGTWWMGAFGKKSETTAGTETFHPSVIHYEADFSSIIEEIRTLEDLGIGTVNGIQGVTIDPVGSKLWLSDLARMYCLDMFTLTISPNVAKTAGGLAFNTLTQEVLAWTSSTTVTRCNKATGASGTTFTIRDGNDRDHLFFDPAYGAAGALYTTCRPNGSAGRVVKYDMASMTPVKAWAFEQARAIEGIVVVGNDMYLCSDEYYHNTGDQLNRVKKFTLDASSPDYGNKLTIGWVGNPVVNPGAAFFTHFSGGDGSFCKGIGLLYNTTADRMLVNLRFDGANALLTFTVPSITTECIGTLEIDTVAHTVSLYINGTLNATINNAAVTGSIPSMVWTLGAAYETSAVAFRFGNVKIGGFMVMPNTDYREEIEGALAHRTGNTAKLPAGHPYKTLPPP